MVKRGTTLVETLVVVFIFSLLTTVILTFFAFASRASRHHEDLSENYRAMLIVLDKVETMLQGSRILFCDQRQLVYLPINPRQPVMAGGWPNAASESITLFIKTEKQGKRYLCWRSKEKETVLSDLKDETLMFAWDKTSDIVSITLTGQHLPTQGIGQKRTYSYVRKIGMESF